MNSFYLGKEDFESVIGKLLTLPKNDLVFTENFTYYLDLIIEKYKGVDVKSNSAAVLLTLI